MFKRTKIFVMMMVMVLMVGIFSAVQAEDLGKIKFVVADWGTGIYDMDEENEITWNKLQGWLEEDNLEVEFDMEAYPGGSFRERVNVIFASGKRLDAMRLPSGWAVDYVGSDGIALTLDEMLNEYGQNLLDKIPQAAWETATFNGKKKFIPDYKFPSQAIFMYRKGLLEEAGMDVSSNELTLAELEQALQIYKDNGLVPIGGELHRLTFILEATFGMPSDGYQITEDGSVIPRQMNPKYKKVVATLRKWVDKGWLPADFLITKGRQWNDMYTSGKLGVLAQHTGWTYHKVPEVERNVEGADGDVIYRIDPTEDKKGLIHVSKGTGGALMIPRTAQNAEGVIKYLNWLFEDKKRVVTGMHGVKGVHYDINWDNLSNFVRLGKYKDPSVPKYKMVYALNLDYGAVFPIKGVYGCQEYDNFVEYFTNLPQEAKNFGPLTNKLISLPDDLKVKTKDFSKKYSNEVQKIIVGDEPLSHFDEILAQMKEEWSAIQEELTPIIKDIIQ